jgi:hypothetical protein
VRHDEPRAASRKDGTDAHEVPVALAQLPPLAGVDEDARLHGDEAAPDGRPLQGPTLATARRMIRSSMEQGQIVVVHEPRLPGARLSILLSPVACG